LQTLGEAVDMHTLQGELLAFIVGFAQDRVPNIRFNVAKALERLALKIEPVARAGSVRPALMLLASDAEDDVKFFATRALAKL
jgi:serine/threonine-protein phosphatase 2A regulatory subunit A